MKGLGFGKGTLQGSLISPDLFRIVLDQILKDLEKKGARVYAYADDICILSKDLRATNVAINYLSQKIGNSGL